MEHNKFICISVYPCAHLFDKYLRSTPFVPGATVEQTAGYDFIMLSHVCDVIAKQLANV